MRRREFTAGAMAAAVGSLLAAPTRAAAPTGAPAASIPTVDAAGVRKLLDAPSAVSGTA